MRGVTPHVRVRRLFGGIMKEARCTKCNATANVEAGKPGWNFCGVDLCEAAPIDKCPRMIAAIIAEYAKNTQHE